MMYIEIVEWADNRKVFPLQREMKNHENKQLLAEIFEILLRKVFRLRTCGIKNALKQHDEVFVF